MKLAAIQAHWLLTTLKDSLQFDTTMFSYTRKQREDMYNAIVNQQDKTIRSLDEFDNTAAPVLQQGGENNTKGESNAGINDNDLNDSPGDPCPEEGDEG